MSGEGLEEHFIVRVADETLRQSLSQLLSVVEEKQPDIQLIFESERVGKLTIQDADGVGHEYAVTLHDLPTIVETYKSHNHINLVKLSDIGQALFVHARDDSVPLEDWIAALQEQEAAGELQLELDDGVTMPMRNARARVFRKTFNVGPELVQLVEDHLVSILNGEAPDGWKFEDVEETFVVDKKTGKGKWTPSSDVYTAAATSKSRATAAAEKKAAALAAKQKQATASDMDDDI